MRMLEDANRIIVSAETLRWALCLPVPRDLDAGDPRFLDILEHVREEGSHDPAGTAVAIGWRLQALEAFLASAEGDVWSDFDRLTSGSANSLVLSNAAVEPIVERDRRPRFDHSMFAARLLEASKL